MKTYLLGCYFGRVTQVHHFSPTTPTSFYLGTKVMSASNSSKVGDIYYFNLQAWLIVLYIIVLQFCRASYHQLKIDHNNQLSPIYKFTTTSLSPLKSCITLFYRYYTARHCHFAELCQWMLPPLRRVCTTRKATQSHPFFVQLPNAKDNLHVLLIFHIIYSNANSSTPNLQSSFLLTVFRLRRDLGIQQ